MKEKTKPAARKVAAAKSTRTAAKTGRPTLFGVPILDPPFRPKDTTVRAIRAAVRAANARRPSV